jgi:hypothetical protein
MELFDDWSVHPRASAPAAAAARRRPAPGREGAAPATPQAIAAQLGAVEPAVIQVNCFEDVGYLWVQLSFDVVVDPGVALRAGSQLVALMGDIVRFNSLRPKAVYFVLDAPVGEPPPDLPASRYGVRMDELADAWRPAMAGTPRASARRRG